MGSYRELETVFDLTGLDRDDKIVVDLDNIEAMSVAEVVVGCISPLVRMLFCIENTVLVLRLLSC